MSWAYADKPEMTELLGAEYTNAGRLNNAQVVPAGLAFARSVKERPDINLYVADKRHPTLAGTYLGACTVLASLYGVNPEGNTYTAGLDTATAKFLQTVAWQPPTSPHPRCTRPLSQREQAMHEPYET